MSLLRGGGGVRSRRSSMSYGTQAGTLWSNPLATDQGHDGDALERVDVRELPERCGVYVMI